MEQIESKVKRDPSMLGKRAAGKAMILVIILGSVLMVCSRDKSDNMVPEGSEAGDMTIEPCVFETKSGRYNADCGTLIVPESWDKTASRLIALPIMRVHAIVDKPAEPVFYLAGGPGQSNMKFKPPDDLLANHDFVLVGYRGVDGSSGLDCPEVKRAIKGIGGDLLSPSSLTNLGKAFRQCATRLQAEGVDLNAYTMLDVIRDMETARTTLGYGCVNLLSQSYGTRIAQIYAYQHPKIIHRSVMVGVNPPGRFVWEPDTIDRQIEYYGRLCAQDSGCNARTSDLTQTMRNVIHNMPRHWLFLPIDAGKVKLITFALLYHRNTAAQVFDTYIAAEKGDPSGLALMTVAYNLMFPSMITWGDLAAKAISADFDRTRDYATEMDPPHSILGSPFSKLLWSLVDWPTASIPDEFRKAQHSSVETLLLSGSVDFSTPAEYATHELLPLISNGKQVILAEMGHTNDLWNVQRTATIRLLTSFYDTGVADDSLFTYAPMDFHVSWGFPKLAKIAIAFVLLIVLGLLGLVWVIIRRIRRRIARQVV
ncbi:MAG: alpha/beta hydrolase [Bacteroidales bacterium]|nr:alpha/beta hydrolase [Bacteroidales bacterium]